MYLSTVSALIASYLGPRVGMERPGRYAWRCDTRYVLRFALDVFCTSPLTYLLKQLKLDDTSTCFWRYVTLQNTHAHTHRRRADVGLQLINMTS